MKTNYRRSKLSFKSIPVEKKIEAVSKVMFGENIQPVAREIEIHRTSIYIWEKEH